MAIKQVEGKFLEELVKDCITYRLSEKEALQYIEFRFKRISEASFKLKKAHILSDKSTRLWLDHFSRIGFIQHHKKQLEDAQRIQDHSLRQLVTEISRNMPDQDLILTSFITSRNSTRVTKYY
ncbi:MAG: hypothetical protein WB975_13330 [Nitrososphaeraceae archaeon]